MQVRNEVQTGLAVEIRILPVWAWTLAGIVFIAAQVFLNLMLAGQDGLAVWIRVLFGLAAGTVLGGYVLLVGYVNRDAARRGMSPALWTIVAILITNGPGIILYFILRQPLRRTCPQCGNVVQTGFNFCPRCSSQLSPNCTHCQRLVGASDIYCPYCGTAVREAVPVAQA